MMRGRGVAVGGGGCTDWVLVAVAARQGRSTGGCAGWELVAAGGENRAAFVGGDTLSAGSDGTVPSPHEASAAARLTIAASAQKWARSRRRMSEGTPEMVRLPRAG